MVYKTKDGVTNELFLYFKEQILYSLISQYIND